VRCSSNAFPIRTCVGCRERREQHTMVRFTRGADGWIADGVTRRPGRGAYICSAKCVGRVTKNKRFPGLSRAAQCIEPFSAPGRSY
jgi:predicted RNA-binding protein YlxR (DUF448 family)